MRVSTLQTFQRSTTLMSQLTAKADLTQTQIATGKRLLAPSDAPAAYRQLATLRRADADDKAYEANVETAQGVLKQGGDALANVQLQLQRAQELFTTAATGTLSQGDREAIGKELESIRDTLLSIANSRDSRGQPLFAGATGDLPYEQDAYGTVRYVSSGEPSGIPIGEQTSISAGITGDRAFAAGDGSDMFAVIAAFTTALSGGGDMQEVAREAMRGTTVALENVTLAQTSLGAREARLDLVANQLSDASMGREETRKAIEDTDLTTAIAEFQKTLTILQATQASFTKLTSLSLFDHLR